MYQIILKERALYNRAAVNIAKLQIKAFPVNSINHLIASENLIAAKAVLAELITIQKLFDQSKYLDK